MIGLAHVDLGPNPSDQRLGKTADPTRSKSDVLKATVFSGGFSNMWAGQALWQAHAELGPNRSGQECGHNWDWAGCRLPDSADARRLRPLSDILKVSSEEPRLPQPFRTWGQTHLTACAWHLGTSRPESRPRPCSQDAFR